jgi:hypothetical protein
MKKIVWRVAAGAGLALASMGAFAQASGAAINDTAIVSNITSVSSTVTDIGGAVLAVVVVAWGYRMVKGFIGR